VVNDPRFAPNGPGDLDLSRGIDVLQSETPRVRNERGVHVHGFGNPHYWLDPENARPMTQAIVDALARLGPGERETFARNRTRLLERLDADLARGTATLAPYRGPPRVGYHRPWPHLAPRSAWAWWSARRWGRRRASRRRRRRSPS